MRSLSLREERDDLAGRIRLHRQVDQRPIIVVEGPSDKRLIERVFQPWEITYFIASNRVAVLRAAAELHTMRVPSLACLVDRDFDDEIEVRASSDLPVRAWLGADLEDMLLHSPAGRHFVEELGSSNKIRTYGGLGKLFSHARAELLPISRLRRANAIGHWGLAFDAIDLRSKIHKQTLKLNVDGLCNALASASKHCNIPTQDLQVIAADGQVPSCSSYGHPLIRGKDLCNLLGVALRRQVGSLSHASSEEQQLARTLRSSVDVDWFRQTRWFAELADLLGLSPALP